ncbi:MAG: UxaA family hydrolase [Acidobacteriota bacterium]|nr:UxaA family hydrolase [Acidobacteriota bacterium]
MLIISVRDNVATALERLEPGRRIEVENTTLVAIEPIAAGHKIALRPIAAGAPVLKYGSPIGTAIADIPAGAHVHTHNVASSRGRGDLQIEAPDSERQPRPAEPPDALQSPRPH